MTILTDLAFEPQTFAQYVQDDLAKRSKFFLSGAVVASPAVVPTQGRTVTLPAWDGLAGESEVLDDDGALTPVKMDSSAQVAAINERGKLYGRNDLVASMTASDPFASLGQKIATFWQRDHDALLVNSMVGAANGIDDSGSVVLDGATNNIDLAMIIDARALFGEWQRDGLMIVVNSTDFAKLQKDDVVDLIPGSQTGVIQSVNDMPLIISDTLPAGVAALVRPGAFLFADGTEARRVFETDRDIARGDDMFSIRRRYVLHPAGAAFLSESVAGVTPTNVELANPVNWDLGVDSALKFGVRLIDHSND